MLESRVATATKDREMTVSTPDSKDKDTKARSYPKAIAKGAGEYFKMTASGFSFSADYFFF